MLTRLLLLSACAPKVDPGPVVAEVLQAPVHVFTAPVADSDTLHLTATIDAGAAYDPIGYEGLAHLVGQALRTERLTATKARTNTPETTDSAHLDVTLKVELGVVELSLQCPANEAPMCIQHFTTMLTKPTFEVDTVVSLQNQAMDSLLHWHGYTEEVLSENLLHAMVYEGTPYGHPVQGRTGTLPLMTAENLRQFYDTHYVRSNMTIGIAGAFTAEHETELARALETLATRPSPELRKSGLRVNDAPMLRVVEHAGDTAAFHLGAPIRSNATLEDRVALWVGLYALQESARTEPQGPDTQEDVVRDASEVESPPPTLGIPKIPARHFQFGQANLSPASTAFAIKAAVVAIEQSQAEGLATGVITNALQALKTHHVQRYGTTAARLSYDVRQVRRESSVPFEAITGLLETLTPEAVNTALKDYLTTENLYYSVVTPESSTLLTQLTEESSVPVVYANNDESVDPQQWADTIAKKDLQITPSHAKIIDKQRLFQ